MGIFLFEVGEISNIIAVVFSLIMFADWFVQYKFHYENKFCPYCGASVQPEQNGEQPEQSAQPEQKSEQPEQSAQPEQKNEQPKQSAQPEQKSEQPKQSAQSDQRLT